MGHCSHRCRAARNIAAWAGALLLAGCAAGPGAGPSRPWSEVRTRHFVFYTDLPAARAEALAVDLELFRAAVAHMTDARRLDPPIPVRIFVFSSRRSFRAFAASDDIAGFIQPTLRSYDVAFSGTSAAEYRKVLYHEYVHFVLRNQPDVLYPKWYDEGFAEFLSTTRRQGDRLIVGEIDRDAAGWLNHGPPLPIERVLDADGFSQLSRAEIGAFYAWSWLLVHLLAMDHEYARGESFSASLGRYIEETSRGVPEADAFASAWGFDTRTLAHRLHALKRSVGFGGIPLAALDFDESVSSSAIAPGTAARLLGELALQVGKTDLARAYFERALSTDPDDARARAGLGDTAKLAEDWESARGHFERAVELAPADPLTRLDHGEYWLHRAIADGRTPKRGEWLRRARREFRLVLEDDPDHPEALAVLGISQLVDGNPGRAILQLEHAFEILPHDWTIQTRLMEAYASAGSPERAERIARRLLVAAHDPEQAEALRRFLRQLAVPAP